MTYLTQTQSNGTTDSELEPQNGKPQTSFL